MAYPNDRAVQSWLDALEGLEIRVQKMFGCYCVYCEDQPVGWLSSHCFSLHEVGLPYLPEGIKRPLQTDQIQEIVIPLEDCHADWLRKAVRDTAHILKEKRRK